MNEQERRTYYISIGAGEIFSVPDVSPWQFRISATDKEIKDLRHIFNSNYNNSMADFARAHVPFVEYHNDSTNDRYDANLIRIYQLIYDLGDQEAKAHIEEMGILEDFTSK